MKRLSDNFLTMLLPLSRHCFPYGSNHGWVCVFHPLYNRVDWSDCRTFPFVQHHHRQMVFQRPFSSDRFVVFDFAVACLYIYARQTYGLDYVYHHAFAFCRAFPVALHHRNGIRQTNKVMAGAKMEQTYPQKATGYERIG